MSKLMFCRPALLLIAVLIFCGCDSTAPEELKREAGSITLMTWNINNLFDGSDDGNEYAEFLQSAGWSNEKYLGRINSLAAAVGKIDPLPDIIMFQEVESREVLDDLAQSIHKDFTWSHFAVNPGSAIGLGIISRMPLHDAKSHSISINGDTTPRPVLETRVQTKDGDFILFTCHWKSKIGGDDTTESTRRSSARVILRRIREIWESEPKTGVIVAGDLNENYDEFFRQSSGYICALLPDDPYCVMLTNAVLEGQKDFLIVSGSRPPAPVHFPQETVVLFSPWLNEIENGSYSYKNNWETIDHFLVSRQFFDDEGWEYNGAFAASFEPFTNANGFPVSYNPRTGYGLSDHLPLLITLKLKE